MVALLCFRDAVKKVQTAVNGELSFESIRTAGVIGIGCADLILYDEH